MMCDCLHRLDKEVKISTSHRYTMPQRVIDYDNPATFKTSELLTIAYAMQCCYYRDNL